MKTILAAIVLGALPFIATAEPAKAKWGSAASTVKSYAASIETTDEGVIVVMRASGERYLYAVGGAPNKVTEYGQRITVPFGSKLKLTGKHVELSIGLVKKEGSSLVVMVEKLANPSGEREERDSAGKIGPDHTIQDLDETKGRALIDR